MVGSNGMVETNRDFVEGLGDLSDPSGRDVAPIGDDVGLQPLAL
jgi:hypothetical protein